MFETSRDRYRIYSIMLEACNTQYGMPITRLMQTTFLSHNQMKEFTGRLLDMQLLVRNGIDNRFHITEKGLRVLKLMTDLLEMISFSSSKNKT